jgi:hypothetical protein
MANQSNNTHIWSAYDELDSKPRFHPLGALQRTENASHHHIDRPGTEGFIPSLWQNHLDEDTRARHRISSPAAAPPNCQQCSRAWLFSPAAGGAHAGAPLAFVLLLASLWRRYRLLPIIKSRNMLEKWNLRVRHRNMQLEGHDVFLSTYYLQ